MARRKSLWHVSSVRLGSVPISMDNDQIHKERMSEQEQEQYDKLLDRETSKGSI